MFLFQSPLECSHGLVLLCSPSLLVVRVGLRDRRIILRAIVKYTLVRVSRVGVAAVVALIAWLFVWIPVLLFGRYPGWAATFFALIPLVGTAILWVPGVLVLVSQGDLGHATFLAIWCMVVVGAVDNFLRPMLISGRAEVPTLAVFVGVMGGLSAFGFIGLFLGPIVLGLLVALFRFESEELESTRRSG